MATTKTLTPTNVTISIPEFTDQPDQRVNSNCIDKEADAINTLSEQIANVSSAYKKDISSLSGLKSDILTFADAMEFKEVRPYMFWVGADSAPFTAGYIYEGVIAVLAKSSGNATRITAFFSNDIGDQIVMGYNNGTWVINQSGVNMVIAGSASVASGSSAEVSLPSGCTHNNCIIVSVVGQASDGNIFNGQLYAKLLNTGKIKYFNDSSTARTMYAYLKKI